MKKRSSLLLIALMAMAIIIYPMNAFAGAPHVRNGWTAGGSLGVGPGSFKASGGGDSGTEAGLSLNVRIGRALSPAFTVNFETDSWFRTESTDFNEDVTFSFWNFAAAGTFYPSQTSGFYVRGGVAYANADIDVVQGNTTVGVSESGFGFLASVGYEWRLAPNFAVGATGGYDYLIINGDLYDSAQFGFVAVDFNWYFGMSAN